MFTGQGLSGVFPFLLGLELCKTSPPLLSLLKFHFLTDLTLQFVERQAFKNGSGARNLPGPVNVYGMEALVGPSSQEETINEVARLSTAGTVQPWVVLVGVG